MRLKKMFYTPIIVAARWEVWKFDRSCRRVAQIQGQLLKEKLLLNGASRMGRKLGIPSLTSMDGFRARVPLTTYDDYSDAIEKCKEGDTAAILGPGQRVVMFALSSGTTGRTKFIPVTKKFLKEYYEGWLTWGYYAYQPRSLGETKLLPITAPSSESVTPSGIPCGAISGLTVDCQNWLTKRLVAVPKEVYQIEDPQTKYYVMAIFALAHKVEAITSANPSTILTFARLVQDRREQILADIEKGTLDGAGSLKGDQRDKIQRMLRPNSRLASRLRGLLDQHGGLYPKHYWPALSIVSNWKGGTLSRYLDFYPEYFGSTEVRDIGLIASEGRMSIPVSGEGAGGVLDVRSQFYEFIPEEAIEDKPVRTVLAHEVEKGKRYFIVLTTASGFYRYDIRDLVEITGFYHQAPVLKFLNKGRHISSITGEKISEFQVVEAVNHTARQFELGLESYCMFPKWGKIPHYGLLVEEGTAGTQNLWAGFLKELDRELCRLNYEYQSKRSSVRLGPVSLFFAPKGTFAAIKEERLRARGGRLEQYKHVFLVPDENWIRQFQIVREFYVAESAESKVTRD